MLPYPQIKPEILRGGPLALRWYGLMYLIGFAASYMLVGYQIKKKGLSVSRDFLDSLYTFIMIGLVAGARLGYVIFYNLTFYLDHPQDVFAVWQGGMSFHGGLIGSVLAGVWCCKRHGVDAWQVADLVVATGPIGLGCGRIGNFINGELYGRATNVPWAMVFPAGGPLPRHPSQLYEFFLEGVVLFLVLWTAKNRMRASGLLAALFLLLYGTFRFSLEFFREPDPQLGFVLGPFTMGQLLSAGMVSVGIVVYFVRRKKPSSLLRSVV